MNPTVIPRGYAWVSLRVADLERSVDWYADVLDLAPMVTNSDTCAVDAIERFSYLIHTESLLMVGLHHDPACGRRRWCWRWARTTSCRHQCRRR